MPLRIGNNIAIDSFVLAEKKKLIFSARRIRHCWQRSASRADPRWRASAVGVYRLWRDLGYAAGALLSGIVADAFGFIAAIVVVGTVTCLSGLVVAFRMVELRPAIVLRPAIIMRPTTP